MKWYQKTWATVLFLFLFPPVGIFLMFKYRSWKMFLKIICAILSACFFCIALSQPSSENVSPAPTPISTETPTPTSTPIPTPTFESVYSELGISAPTDIPTTAPVEQIVTYVLNTSTKKFHKLSCSDVKKIKSSNYSTVDGRDSAISRGYSPCKRCNP